LIVFYKLIQIISFAVPSRTDINAIIDALVNERSEEAARIAKKMPGMSGDLVRTGVTYFYDKRKVLEEALFEKLMGIKPHLDKFLPFLGLTAAVAPLMGLLGTVLGIIKTFQSMVLYGTGNAKNFSAGISEALITTAEGLIVAIPVLVLHGLMKSLAKAKSGEVEGIAIALMNGTTEIDRSKSKASKESQADDDDFELNLPAKA
jgi:biopolymer transport protein ExbB